MSTSDRRQFGRRTTQLHGWIRIPGRPPLACLVRDFSEGGALLVIAADTWLPFRFRLEIEATVFQSGCEIRHRHPGTVGVCFVAAKTGHDAPQTLPVDDPRNWAGHQPARTTRT